MIFSEDQKANEQINIIWRFVRDGLDDEVIAHRLKAEKIINLKTGDYEWTSDEITRIRKDFRLDKAKPRAIKIHNKEGSSPAYLRFLRNVGMMFGSGAFFLVSCTAITFSGVPILESLTAWDVGSNRPYPAQFSVVAVNKDVDTDKPALIEVRLKDLEEIKDQYGYVPPGRAGSLKYGGEHDEYNYNHGDYKILGQTDDTYEIEFIYGDDDVTSTARYKVTGNHIQPLYYSVMHPAQMFASIPLGIIVAMMIYIAGKVMAGFSNILINTYAETNNIVINDNVDDSKFSLLRIINLFVIIVFAGFIALIVLDLMSTESPSDASNAQPHGKISVESSVINKADISEPADVFGSSPIKSDYEELDVNSAAVTEAREKYFPALRRNIIQYRKDRGVYPKTLDALVPDYMDNIPDVVNPNYEHMLNIDYRVSNCDKDEMMCDVGIYYQKSDQPNDRYIYDVIPGNIFRENELQEYGNRASNSEWREVR